MRLTCPNCNAQYEVDEAVIPRGGRDVQCSACGHTWYQYPMDVALQMRAAELDDDEGDDDTADAAPAAAPQGGPRDPATPPPMRTDGAARAAPRIDKTVLDVLREEAERELSERRRDGGGIETQGDLGLARPTRPRAAAAGPAVAAAPLANEEREAPRRRNLLPDIEELTSTLEPGSEHRTDDTPETDAPRAERQGFRRGLTAITLVAMALVALYVLAPLIVAYLPATRGTLVAYVTGVDAGRAAVAALLRGWFGG